ncbi:MAG: gamma-glutamyltransferase family protein [Candidatus Bipolaricaulota bacterium]
MKFDPREYPYPSRRSVRYARRGMVATSQPLAARAGLKVMEKGGNAVDAAVATAATLTVVEPTSNAIGSDAFALLWSDGELHGLNASGPAPSDLSVENVKSQGYAEMPERGWEPVTVPGAPAGWAALAEEFGELPLDQLLQPAIEAAEEGFPLTPTIGGMWKKAFHQYRELKTIDPKPWLDTFAPSGRPPEIGKIWKSADHAETLHKLAETGCESLYTGELAQKLLEYSDRTGGYFNPQDLEDYAPEWVDPLRVNHRGYSVWELPPNGQGMIALMALQILDDYDFPARDQVETCHRQLEAMKLAFADGKKFITDPEEMEVKLENLLSPAYAESRRKLIGDRALTPEPGKPPGGGTVYLATADTRGNMVSFIQSNFMGFGSGLVVPGTGIALQNRGALFSLNRDHANSLKGGKRSYHTIIPGFLTDQDGPLGPFGVMGGYMQPQGHLQVLMNMIDFQLNPQVALDAPRWRWQEEKKIAVESHFPTELARSLQRKGHRISVDLSANHFGRGQVILKDGSVLIGGTEPRADSAICAF